MLDVKRCRVCDCFVPSLIVDQSSAEPLIPIYLSEQKGSQLYLFMKLILHLKHDRHFTNVLWSDYRMLTEEELKKKESALNDLDGKLLLRQMQNLIASTRMEIKINVKNMDTFGGDEDNDSFLEKLHLNLKNQTREQITARIRYATQMKYMHDYIKYYLNHHIKRVIMEVHHSMESSDKIVAGKKKRSVFECLLFNLKLGFSNWPEVDAFEKENKFVKRLRQAIYNEGVSQLIFQDLTKNEKTRISTKMFIGSKELSELIVMKIFNEQVKRQLSLEMSYSSIDHTYNLEFFLKKKADADAANKTLFERIDFTEAEIFEMRYTTKMNELAEAEKEKLEGEQTNPNNSKKNPLE